MAPLLSRVGAFPCLVLMAGSPVLADPAVPVDVPAVEPTNYPGDWVVPQDYPPDSLLNRQGGIAAFTLDVDRTGKPIDCTITKTSGHTSLDTRTCELVLERARFKPARDSKGKAVAGTYSNRVRWVVPGSSLLDDEGLPSMVVETMVSSAGILESCSVRKRDQLFDSAPDPCAMQPIGSQVMPADAKRPRMIVRMKQTMEFEEVR